MSWIFKLAFVIFESVPAKGLRRLVVYPERVLSEEELSGLVVEAELSIRCPGQPAVIRFTAQLQQIRCAESVYHFALEPLTEEDRLPQRAIRETEKQPISKPTNVKTIKLILNGECRPFFDSEEGYYFCDCRLPRSCQELTGGA